ncbi:hypothetical protein PSHT_08334 [Puccinia striiformis]|uniref:Uncharacterized protein n=1 Tax=Puccinia striiformis TaxID=27350 RepID=A0A2S4VQ52_9BASI|nr:hypothetical protein PSHT_08334 [Puccinia striiformis]
MRPWSDMASPSMLLSTIGLTKTLECLAILPTMFAPHLEYIFWSL